MKKFVLQTMTLSALLLVVGGPSVYAATASGKTTGEVTFKAGDVPKPIKPGTVDPITPTIPTVPVSTDDVHIIKAPSFLFGEVAINPMGDEYPAQQIEVEEGGDKYFLPDFLQVADVSGNDQLVWSVTAEQDTVLTSDVATGNKELEKTRIRIYNQTLTNSTITTISTTDLVGLALADNAGAGVGYSKIPVKGANGESAVTVLESSKKGYTNNTITSNVLMAAYDETDFGVGKSDTLDENVSIQLNVPGEDSPEKIAYTAAITWVLSVTP